MINPAIAALRKLKTSFYPALPLDSGG